jgi:hypothetical protein
MPGRDELIQQNIARASAAAAAPQPQESQGQSSLSGGAAPRSFFGGNFEVYSALDRVKFQGVAGDASMRGNVAYIRLWKRGGSVQQTAALQSAVEPPQSDSQKVLEEDLEAAIGNRDSVANNFDPVTGVYGYSPYGDVDNPIEVAEANIQVIENQINAEKQKALSSQTPTSSTNTSNNAGAISTATSASSALSLNPAVGSVKSANPNGFVNAIGAAGRALIGLPQTSPSYSSGANASKSPATQAPSGEMMWQFLFNPSELELEVGPEFKNSETWGVSDKGNSGQPMHWSHNKNAQLKFNSVLLNGYLFGRKVEVLEQGLIELFMARDGEGQHGPHVLEFVWGKRVFGPCMIKNINIKEKMWDEGEVVNAEVSFTLEQVPEWTINDGFVDVARPGRLATIGDPTQPGSAAAAAAAAAAPATAAAPGSGDSPAQKPSAQNGIIPTALYKKCQKAGVYAEQFYAIQVKAGKSGAGGSKPNVINLRGEYNSLYNRARAELGSELTSRSSYPNADSRKLIVATDISIKVEDAKTGLNVITRNWNSAMSMVENAADSSRRASKAFSDSPTCKAERNKVDQNTKNQQAAQICKNKQAGVSCSSFGVPPGGRIKTCSGIELICGTDGYLKNASTYKP